MLKVLKIKKVKALNSVTSWHQISTLLHHVIYLHSEYLMASLALKNWLSTAALLLSAVLAQACVSWPIRADRVFRRGRGIREELKQHFRQRGNTELQHWRLVCLLTIKACKPFEAETQKSWNPKSWTWEWAEYVSFEVTAIRSEGDMSVCQTVNKISDATPEIWPYDGHNLATLSFRQISLCPEFVISDMSQVYQGAVTRMLIQWPSPAGDERGQSGMWEVSVDWVCVTVPTRWIVPCFTPLIGCGSIQCPGFRPVQTAKHGSSVQIWISILLLHRLISCLSCFHKTHLHCYLQKSVTKLPFSPAWKPTKTPV